jgi:uncharacterized protein
MQAANDNERLVLRFFATLGEGDYDGVRAMFHPEVTWTVMAQNIPGAGVHKGIKAIVDDFMMPIRLGQFEANDPKILVDSILSRGPLVAVESRGVGQMKNGKKYHNLYAWFVEIEDGRIIAIREYMDSQYVTTL